MAESRTRDEKSVNPCLSKRSNIPVKSRSKTSTTSVSPTNSEIKRCRELSSPTGITPKQQEKRPRSRIPLRNMPCAQKRTLALSAQATVTSSYLPPSPNHLPLTSPCSLGWKCEEDSALVRFILLSTSGDSWPNEKSGNKFWESAALFVHQICQEPLRSWLACALRVKRVLSKKYVTPKSAQNAFVKSISSSKRLVALPSKDCAELPSHRISYIDTGEQQSIPVVIDTIQPIKDRIKTLSPSNQIKVISELFCDLAASVYGAPVEEDFIELSMLAIKNLCFHKKSNVLYHLARGLGTQRPNSNEPRFPVSRMPFGMLQYMVTFFSCASVNQATCSDDYIQWLGTMYSLFGTKFSKMLCGPMWSEASTSQTSDERSEKSYTNSFDAIHARVNVPAYGERTMRRRIVDTQFSNSWNIQMSMLDRASKVHPDAKWWIKADGCDVVSGLEESVRLVWNGDADYGTDAVEMLYRQYQTRLSACQKLCTDQIITDRLSALITCVDEQYASVGKDVNFIAKALKKASDAYSAKVGSGSNEKTLLALAWNVDDLQKLSASGRALRVELATLKDALLESTEADIIVLNLARKLAQTQKKLVEFVKGLYRHKRTAATHILVIMISTEARSKKPYALPIQCLSYVGMSVSQMRSILNEIIKAMKEKNMAINGFVSNGEFNSMRVKGYTRPLCVLEIKSLAKKKYNKMSVSAMLNMLTPTEMEDGTVCAVLHNPAVCSEVINEIWEWKKSGIDDNDWIDTLRLRTVPTGYTPCPWSNERREDKADKLRAILSQMEYQHQVRSWDSRGVPFSTYMYVPEVHPITGKEFHEREDVGHVLKRMAQCTRKGGPIQLRLERFNEALYDVDSGLTYPALTGQRKQSVQDAENLFGEGVELFMAKKEYEYEKKYVKVIRNWRRSCDQRGLSSLIRSKYNYQLLNLILDELMPWHETLYDFSLLEVTRKVTVLGFTREIVNALVTSIESIEWKRREYANIRRPMEHSRSSTTDDVECMFSILRDLTGKHFTLRQARNTWRKACIEFDKRLDPDLGFFYFSSSHDRFHEGDRSHFDEKPLKQKSRRIRRREQPAYLMYGRATLPEPGARSTRMSFHNLPVSMPPPLESVSQHLHEHSYT